MVVGAEAAKSRFAEAMRRTGLSLFVQRLVPLQHVLHIRHYEVLLRLASAGNPNVAPQTMLRAASDNGLGATIDQRILLLLCTWLTAHGEITAGEGIRLSINLTPTTLLDAKFVEFVKTSLIDAAVSPRTIGFELDASTLSSHGALLEGATELHRIGCPIILDNYNLHTDGLDILHLPGIEIIKLAPSLVGELRANPFVKASMAATCQMAKMLDILTVAKHARGFEDQELLAQLGLDFMQSNALSPPASIESLV